VSDDSFAHGLIGVTLDGRYRLEAVLGEGGMGSVFRATQLAMDRRVAVKLLKPHLTSDEAALQRFAREARATQRVDSPHAVKILDFGVTPLRDYYMVLEYLDGRTVQRELEIDGAFAPARVAHIARQALAALGAAHAQGLIHRDVKPDNLLLMRQGDDPDYTKILDFGVAKLMQGAAGEQLALTAAGMVFGTPEFMSPEQACGQALDGRSDLYSLAATMFVMLTGETLFEAGTAIEWLTHHARTPPPRLARVRPALAAYPELDDLLQRCLAKRKEQRPADAAAMARQLADLAPSLARPPGAGRAPTTRPNAIRASTFVPALTEGGLAPAGVPGGAQPGPGVRDSLPAPALTAPGESLPALVPATTGGTPLRSGRGRWLALGAIAVVAVIAVAIVAAARRSSRTTSIGASGSASARPSGSDAGDRRPDVGPGEAPATGSGPQPTTASGDPHPTTTSGDPRPTTASGEPHPATASGEPRPAAGSASPGGGGEKPTLSPQPGDPRAKPPKPGRAPATPPDEHLAAAEEAFKAGNTLRQVAEADLALRAHPGSARARFLLGDALLKSGDLDRGCGYLAALKRLPAARDRARAAGCPGD
jgi:serine/threonine-protein kinase